MPVHPPGGGGWRVEMTSSYPPTGVLVHTGFFYDTTRQYLDVISSFLEEGLKSGEPALVAVPLGNLEMIQARLGGSGGTVRFRNMSVLGRNPSRIIPAVRRFTDAHRGVRTRFVGEPLWAGRSPAEIEEATRHEALVNAAFADVPTTILCPYPTAGLDAAVLADAETTHPQLLGNGRTGVSPRYTGTAAALAIAARRLPAAPRGAEENSFGAGDLPGLRRLVRERAVSAGLSGERAEDLTIAVNEAASNTVSHTGAPGTLRMWQDATAFVCEICDTGQILDPMAGRRPAGAVGHGGHGLHVVNQVCDLVELRTGPWGTAVRMHMDRA
jgi:anti-sigma regulatory factor (Ser/Thr protein kinase)